MKLDLVSYDSFLTLGGCTMIVLVFTELSKNIKFLNKISTQWVSLFLSLICMCVRQLVIGTFQWADIPIILINAVIVCLASNGGYDAIDGFLGGRKKEK